jgi:hypothetical protein
VRERQRSPEAGIGQGAPAEHCEGRIAIIQSRHSDDGSAPIPQSHCRRFLVRQPKRRGVIASRAPALVAACGTRASYRFLEFFAAQIRNPHTRRAYARAATEFFDWLVAKGVTQLAAIESVHVAAYIEQLSQARSAPTAKLRLAALRHLFDWMVIGQIMPTNPTAAVRGPHHIVRSTRSTRRPSSVARPRLDRADGLFLRAHRHHAHLRSPANATGGQPDISRCQ